MHYITALHPTNDAVTFRSSITMPGIALPASATTVAFAGGKPFVAIAKFGPGRAVQWGSYDWMVSTVLGPVDGLDDLIWRGIVWAGRKPLVMRGMPNLVSFRIDDVSGPLWWAHVANQVGFKPYLAVFLNDMNASVNADIHGLTTNGNATAAVHSFGSSDMFYFNHQTESPYSDSVQSNNFYLGTQWHLTNGIPISKVCATHYSEIGPNAFAGLKAWGMEYVPIEVVPGSVEYAAPYAPWVVAGPYRLYETPQQGQVNWPTYYADWLVVPGHPEYSNTFFNAYCEVRDYSACAEWCPDNDVAGTIARGTAIVKRDLDSMAMATLFTHEWYIHPTPCCSEGAAITTNNFLLELQGITNSLARYHPIFVTLDYASQYMRATRTSRLVSASVDSQSGTVAASFTGKADLDMVVYIFTGADSSITFALGNVPAFSTSTTNTVIVSGPPTITLSPASQTNNAGTAATFTVGATGTSPFTYQWLRNGTNALSDGGNITGATNSTLSLNSVMGADGGSYSVIVGNIWGSTTSAPPALFTVIDPVITGQPTNMAVASGATASFSVGVIGTSPAYQWFCGGAPIVGATAAMLTLTNVGIKDGTNYSVLVSNSFGSAISSNAVLTVVDVPTAGNDSYSVQAGSILTVLAPGVLGNDADAAGDGLTAQLLTSPLHGALKLSGDGEITYIPAAGYVGTDAFTYLAANAQTNSAAAIVSLSITSDVAFVSDDFTRLSDPGPLSPWVVETGNWAVTGGVLQGGTNALQNYGFAYLTNTFTNCVARGQVQFSSTSAWGGGIGGRLNPATGAHYAAWIYPENSPGGSNVLRLIKFQNWGSFEYGGAAGAAMQTVNLASVGTNLHTLKLALHGSRIAVYFDGRQVMSVTDTEAQPYFSGGVSADLWTFSTSYKMTVDNVVVRPLAVNDSFSMDEDSSLVIHAPGVLTNDTPVYGTNLVAILASSPTHGFADLSTNGGFTYTPAEDFSGTDSFTYIATDGTNALGSATVTINVGAPESPQIVTPPSGLTTNAGATIVLSAKALGASPLTYQWFLNATNQLVDGAKISGSTAPTLAISNVLGADAGFYTVVVSNTLGSTTSTPPTQLVVNDPVINAQPASCTNIAGTMAMFAVEAYGTTPAYQWLKSGVAIPGATAATLNFAAVSNSDAATYSVIVSNTYGCLTSQTAQLVLVPQPTIATVRQTNGVVTIAWNSCPGPTYRLQYRNSLSDPIWHDVQPEIFATGFLTTATAPLGTLPQRLYRVILVQPMGLPFVITSFQQTNGVVSLTWNSVFGQNYRLQYKRSVTDTNWRDLLPGVTANGSMTTATNVVGTTSNRLYRVALGQGTPPPPKINSVSVLSNTATAIWNSIAGQTYRLQYKNSLGDPAWRSIVPDIVANGTATSGSDIVGAITQRFYRVVLLP